MAALGATLDLSDLSGPVKENLLEAFGRYLGFQRLVDQDGKLVSDYGGSKTLSGESNALRAALVSEHLTEEESKKLIRALDFFLVAQAQESAQSFVDASLQSLLLLLKQRHHKTFGSSVYD